MADAQTLAPTVPESTTIPEKTGSEDSPPATPPAFLSTQNYRGTRDFFPEQQRIRTWLFDTLRSVMMQFGYEEYDGPLVEYLELYASKSSQEIVQEQLYAFKDRGDRWLGIRPEMTPTLARMVASKHRELPRPIRWFSIPTCMRYERPQRGRLREFSQLNVDIFGGLGIDEDIEVVLTCIQILLKFGAAPTDFEVRVNHRGVMNEFLYGKLQLPQTLKADLLRLLDKRDKMTGAEFKAEAHKLGLNDGHVAELDTFFAGSIADVAALLAGGSEAAGSQAQGLKDRIDAINTLAGFECVKFDATVMRGFDYYTGLVFEIYDTHPDNRRAVFGGGRYDNLVGAFGADALSGIGYGTSDVSLLNFLEVHGLLPQLKKPTQVSVLRFGEADRLDAALLAQKLRSFGLNVECAVTAQKFGKQIQGAEKAGAKVVVFRGETEQQTNTVGVKWLTTGVQEIVPFAELEALAKKIAELPVR